MNAILDFFKLASESDLAAGFNWYQSALAECKALAIEFKVDVKRVAYIVAALSPALPWDKNIDAARAILSGADKAHSAYGANVRKAQAILHSDGDYTEILSGNKVRSFAANILGDDTAVTVDRWAYRVWAGDLKANPPSTPIRNYHEIAGAFRDAAEQIGISAPELQAITWTTARRLGTDYQL